jgi:PAS domain S-box-containing protein
VLSQNRTADTQLFRDVFNASPIGIAVENLEGQPLFVNPAFCSILGFSEEELRGKHCVDFSPPEDAAKDWALFQKLRAGAIDHYQLEKRYFRRDGSLVWGRLSISRLNSRPSPLVIAMVEDITDKKNAEEARFRLAAIVESSDDAIASGTLDGIIVSWNAGAQKLYGYTEAEALGKPINMLVPPELPEEENKILEMLRAGGRIENFETVRVTKTGKRINISLSISPIKDSSGKVVGLSGIARDISDRKRDEEKLREYERAVENAQDMIGVVDREYRFLLANRQYLKMRNLTREQVVGHLVPDVLNKEIFETVIKPELDECFKGKVVRYERTFSYPEVGKRHLLLSYFPIEGANGTIDRAACILTDITERKQAEEAMREMNRALEGKSALLQSQEELLRIFVKNVPVAVAMLDRDMRYLQVSDRWCSDNSVEASELLGRSRYDSPEMPERWKEVNRRALQGETLRADEDRWESGGSTRWARWEVRPWRNHAGAVGGILVFAEDITPRKHMEEHLAGMSRKLIEAQEQERSRVGRELHDDINQRLAILSLELERLQENPSEIQERVQELRKSVAELSNDVQALSHDLHSSKLEYLGVVAAIESWCKEFGEKQGMQIEYRHDVRSTFPQEVGLCLFRVLQEALQNAGKHSGVKRIEVQLREESGEIHLIVLDSGRGFDIEAARQGRGLGLTSMRERIRLVHGTIDIQSTPTGGTTIHARVPFTWEHVPRTLAV